MQDLRIYILGKNSFDEDAKVPNRKKANGAEIPCSKCNKTYARMNYGNLFESAWPETIRIYFEICVFIFNETTKHATGNIVVLTRFLEAVNWFLRSKCSLKSTKHVAGYTVTSYAFLGSGSWCSEPKCSPSQLNTPQ